MIDPTNKHVPYRELFARMSDDERADYAFRLIAAERELVEAMRHPCCPQDIGKAHDHVCYAMDVAGLRTRSNPGATCMVTTEKCRDRRHPLSCLNDAIILRKVVPDGYTIPLCEIHCDWALALPHEDTVIRPGPPSGPVSS